jgi:dATP/dGTP diphosphohydrolase, N-terminal
MSTTSGLPTNSSARKAIPLVTGVLDYFPDALAAVAQVSKAGNDKHNGPETPLHHSRGRSSDHADALLRHLVDRGSIDPDTGQRHSAEVAWRALALLQQELEDAGAPMARGAVAPAKVLHDTTRETNPLWDKLYKQQAEARADPTNPARSPFWAHPAGHERSTRGSRYGKDGD